MSANPGVDENQAYALGRRSGGGGKGVRSSATPATLAWRLTLFRKRLINPSASIRGSLYGWRAAVTAANTVTIYLTVSVSLSAATRTFKVRVIG